jgi:hypothetical protein
VQVALHGTALGDHVGGVLRADESRRDGDARRPAVALEGVDGRPRLGRRHEHVEVAHRPQSRVAVGGRGEGAPLEHQGVDPGVRERAEESATAVEERPVPRGRLLARESQRVPERIVDAVAPQIGVEQGQEPPRRAVQPREVDSRAERLPGRARLGRGQDGGLQQERLIGVRPVGACMVVLRVAHALSFSLGPELDKARPGGGVYGIGGPPWFRSSRPRSCRMVPS